MKTLTYSTKVISQSKIDTKLTGNYKIGAAKVQPYSVALKLKTSNVTTRLLDELLMLLKTHLRCVITVNLTLVCKYCTQVLDIMKTLQSPFFLKSKNRYLTYRCQQAKSIVHSILFEKSQQIHRKFTQKSNVYSQILDQNA